MNQTELEFDEAPPEPHREFKERTKSKKYDTNTNKHRVQCQMMPWEYATFVTSGQVQRTPHD